MKSLDAKLLMSEITRLQKRVDRLERVACDDKKLVIPDCNGDDHQPHCRHYVEPDPDHEEAVRACEILVSFVPMPCPTWVADAIWTVRDAVDKVGK